MNPFITYYDSNFVQQWSKYISSTSYSVIDAITFDALDDTKLVAALSDPVPTLILHLDSSGNLLGDYKVRYSYRTCFLGSCSAYYYEDFRYLVS